MSQPRHRGRSWTAPTVLQQRVEHLRVPRLELDALSRAGMAKTEIFAVKCKPANGIRAAAVNFVADDREALLGEMNTDLMLAPGFQLHANQARFRTAFHNVHMSDGKLTCSFLPG